ncbi:hypothetical protein QBC47DRAFT_440205 [Echria macrotheca]|uniref:Uncharacterized protein n=1 Tax=Echria macrotheca TaxID=438768 RepID=A0AAJ0B0U5_9PEZI|nr:hypothetical protein QBC47DRAFT_440205 [Echria macrotheca]
MEGVGVGGDPPKDPAKEDVYCILPASVTGDQWHIAAASILSSEYGKFSTTDPERKKLCDERRGDFGLWFNLIPVVVITYQASWGKRENIKKENIMNAYRKLVASKDYTPEAYLEDLLAERIHGEATFNYLQLVGANPIVAILEFNEMPKQSIVKRYMMSVGHKDYDYLRRVHVQLKKEMNSPFPTFSEILTKVENTRRIHRWEAGPPPIPSKDAERGEYHYRVIDYFAATTIVAQALEGHDAAERRQRLEHLQGRMSNYHPDVLEYKRAEGLKKGGPANPQEAINRAVEAKFKELLNLVQQLPVLGCNPSDAPFHPRRLRRLILYNHRNHRTVNQQTNSTAEIYEAFCKTVEEVDKTSTQIGAGGQPIPEAQRYEISTDIIVINTTDEVFMDGAGKEPRQINLFDKLEWVPRQGLVKGEWVKKPNWEYPGPDMFVTAGFWREVAKRGDIFGVFSGRTGSIDVAMFHGVNVFWWDEPWLEFAARDPLALYTYGINPQDLQAWTVTELQHRARPDNSKDGVHVQSQKKTVREIAGAQEKKDKADGIPAFVEADEDNPFTWVDGIRELAISKLPNAQKTNSLTAGQGAYTSRKKDQIPQCMRCLQLAAASWVGLPEPVLYPNPGGMDDWAEMRKVPLRQWLAGEIQTHNVRLGPSAERYVSVLPYVPPGTPASDNNTTFSEDVQPWTFLGALPLEREVKNRAYRWPYVAEDKIKWHNWFFWEGIIRRNGVSMYEYAAEDASKTKLMRTEVVNDGKQTITYNVYEKVITTQYSVPYSNDTAMRVFTAGRGEKGKWLAGSPWRIESTVLDDLRYVRE